MPVVGIKNYGASCWLNALIQCMRVVLPKNVENDDPFRKEFFRLVREENEEEDTTHFLKMLPFQEGPNDSQEAMIYIIDRLKLKQFVGEITQTVIYPGGRSVTKSECTVWFRSHKREKEEEVVTEYVDATGKKHHIAVIQRELTTVPEILVSDDIQQELFGKNLVGIVHWGFGHYVAFVYRDGDWWCVNDDQVSKATPVLRGYIGFYV